jgi:hypothetical protein
LTKIKEIFTYFDRALACPKGKGNPSPKLIHEIYFQGEPQAEGSTRENGHLWPKGQESLEKTKAHAATSGN